MFSERMMSCITLLVVFSVCVHTTMSKAAPMKRDTCVSNQHTNGCSTPTGYEPYRKEFTPACNEHDVCYFCGTRFGISRKQCDNKFHDKMYNICDGNDKRWFFGAVGKAIVNLFSGKTCKATADVYYAAVGSFGKDYFVNPSPSWCEELCVKNHLRKYYTLV